jgi:hypothetical protein
LCIRAARRGGASGGGQHAVPGSTRQAGGRAKVVDNSACGRSQALALGAFPSKLCNAADDEDRPMSKHAPGTEAKRLLALSEQVSRVAQSLAQLAVGGPGAAEGANSNTDELEVALESVARVIRARSVRALYIPTELFADPAWDIMLHLLHAEIAHGRVSVSSACLASGLPERVGLRWLNTMVEHGLAQVQSDADDLGSGSVELAPEVSRALRRYFREVIEQQ